MMTILPWALVAGLASQSLAQIQPDDSLTALDTGEEGAAAAPAGAPEEGADETTPPSDTAQEPKPEDAKAKDGSKPSSKNEEKAKAGDSTEESGKAAGGAQAEGSGENGAAPSDATPDEASAPGDAAPNTPPAAPPTAEAGEAESAPNPNGFEVGIGVGAAGPKDVTRDEPSSQSDDEKEKKKKKGLFIGGTGTFNVGQGTFIAQDYVRNEFVAWNAALSPSYVLEDKTRFALSFGVTQELSDSDSTTRPQQLLWSDVTGSVSRPIYTIDSTKTAFSGRYSMVAPTSLASQYDTLVTAATLGLTVAQPIDDFSISYSTSFRKNFHERDEADLTCDRQVDGKCYPKSGDLPIAFSRTGGAEFLNGGVAVGGINTSFSWSNTLAAGYTPTKKLSFNLSYTLSYGWAYRGFPLDEKSGVGARGGRVPRPASVGAIGAAYEALEDLEISGGVRTASGVFDSNGQTLRFPFYEFQATASNLSIFYVSATLSEHIPL